MLGGREKGGGGERGWLRGILLKPPVLLLLIGIIIPNLIFVSLALAGLTVPPRTLPIILYVLIAASLRFLPPAAVAVLYFAALLFDVVYCTTQFFGLAPQEALFALQFFGELDILNSQLYALLTVTVVASVGGILFLLLRHGRHAAGGSWSLMLLGGLILIPTDIIANAPLQAGNRFGFSLGTEPAFDSAMLNSGYQALIDAPQDRKMLVIIVEAMGRFADPAHQKLLDDALATPALTAGYRISSGHNSFFGSTTAGEMRELCGTRRSYIELLDQDMTECTPFRLQAQGYRTVGYHGFSPEMFQRSQWWPHIGLTDPRFGTDVHQSGQRLCGEVFVGVCDPDILSHIAADLRADGPQFVYLLTLNTHIPVPLSEAYGHLDCEGKDPIGDFGVCLMVDQWIELLRGIGAMLTEPGMPPVEVLIVGDHAPPLWYRKARDLFEQGHVSWYRLTPR
ncbi:hypothetical protein A8950_3597 [Dongia mobilis]|uniref:Sulfatase-like protein n=2 Tax=Dongia mobilis TaxID=578943 RepID=A0A4V3DDW4_9PROT|nr:hypothetical protein A8950_3597 [Dongia mobilis]